MRSKIVIIGASWLLAPEAAPVAAPGHARTGAALG